jgi:hypothetical protein
MGCKTCKQDLKPRERLIVDRFELAMLRREKCSSCDANDGGQCTESGLPIVELTRDWAASCPRKQFDGVKQSCPNCGRAGQYLSKSSLCRYCEIERENRAGNAGRIGRKATPIRSHLQSVTTLTPSTNNPGGCSVVWVYWEGGQRNDELWHSIQLAHMHLADAGEFLICGDIPQWYDGQAIPSPRVSEQETQLQFGGTRYRKWLDSIIKLQRIIDDPRVTERFIWLYDDTFIVRDTSIEHLAIPRFAGQLSRSNRGSWRAVMNRTAEVLSRNGMPVRNYSTHYPIVFEKSKLREALERFRPDKQPLLIESLYQNQWAIESRPHGSEFEYVQRVRLGWKPRKETIIANVGQFNAPARAAIGGILHSCETATAV